MGIHLTALHLDKQTDGVSAAGVSAILGELSARYKPAITGPPTGTRFQLPWENRCALNSNCFFPSAEEGHFVLKACLTYLPDAQLVQET